MIVKRMTNLLKHSKEGQTLGRRDHRPPLLDLNSPVNSVNAQGCLGLLNSFIWPHVVRRQSSGTRPGQARPGQIRAQLSSLNREHEGYAHWSLSVVMTLFCVWLPSPGQPQEAREFVLITRRSHHGSSFLYRPYAALPVISNQETFTLYNQYVRSPRVEQTQMAGTSASAFGGLPVVIFYPSSFPLPSSLFPRSLIPPILSIPLETEL